MIRMNIKTRIVSYVFASCFVIICLLSSYIYFEMKELIVRTLDSRISTIISGLEEQMTSSGLSLNKILTHKEYNGVYLLLNDSSASYSSALARQTGLPQSGKKKFAEEITTANGSGEYRFVKTEIIIDGHVYSVIAGISIEGISEELEDLSVSILIGTILALIAVGTIGLFIANSILRPVKEIISSANNINSRNFSRRIPTSSTKDEIYELSVTLNNLFDRLEKSFNMQKEFIANISHEIKTPLAVLNLTVDEAIQQEDISEREAGYLMKINSNLNRVNKLVKDIINLSYLETNQLENVEDVHLKEIADEILENLSDMSEAKGLKVALAVDDCVVRGDHRLIYSALMNLMYNAVKYTTASGEIDIALSESDDMTRFSICNTCDDIPEENLDRFFDRFYRVEKSRSRDYGGAGLGLAIVKEIVHKHNGRVSVFKPEQNRICFVIELDK